MADASQSQAVEDSVFPGPNTEGMEWIPCPLCQGDATDKLLSAKDHINRIPGAWDIVQCRVCRHRYVNPRPTPDRIMDFYPDHTHYYQTKAPNKPSSPIAKSGLSLWRQKFTQQVLRQHFGYGRDILPRNGFWFALTLPFKRKQQMDLLPFFPDGKTRPRLLEVGCSTGVRLARLKELGWDVQGLEPCLAAANKAREMGIEVHHCMADDMECPPSSLDCVILCMVVEHLPDPVKTLKLISRWLRPGGQLLLSVPDIRGLEARLFGAYHYSLHLPNHLQHFSPETLRRYLAGYAMKIVHQDSCNDFLGGIRNYLGEYPRSPWRLLRFIPRKAYLLLATALAYAGMTSRMSVIAVKR